MTKNLKTCLAALVLSVSLTSPSMALMFFEAGPPANNVDAAGGVSVFLDVATTGAITDLNFSIETNDAFSPALSLSLISPLGTNVQVYQSAGDSTGFFDVTFDDESLNGVSPKGIGLIGNYLPDNALSAFDGEELSGQWELFIIDNTTFNGDGTAVLAWSISGEPVNTPEASVLNLLAIGLFAGLLVSRRQRRRS